MPVYADAWEVEDFLQSKNVFQNALTGRPAHADAYNTVIDYKLLAAAIDELKALVKREQWAEMAEYWASNAYLSPNQAQLASFVKRTVLVEVI